MLLQVARVLLASLLFLVSLALAPLRASADCTADKYGKCGEVPPATDRYDKPAAKKKPAPKKEPAK